MCSSSFSSPLEETHFFILKASSRCMLVSCGSMLFLIESFLEIHACILWLNVIPYSNFTFIFANSISYITKSTTNQTMKFGKSRIQMDHTLHPWSHMAAKDDLYVFCNMQVCSSCFLLIC